VIDTDGTSPDPNTRLDCADRRHHGCSSSHPEGENVANPSNEEIVRRYYQAQAAHDYDSAGALRDPD
jgi:hypothetical protein